MTARFFKQKIPVFIMYKYVKPTADCNGWWLRETKKDVGGRVLTISVTVPRTYKWTSGYG